ncbi:MAG: hypothetical protein MUQ00_16690 [Candidatus Aminicenantes bacterium]|nr:hypothetical protein [Candidatus Aminicenantes bacterium]
MEKYLLHLCPNQGSEKCHPDVKYVLLPQKIENNGKIPLWPVGKEQEELDKICGKCSEAIFEIEERKCPACRSEKLILPIIISGIVNSQKVYHYICEECRKALFSYTEL